VDVIVVSSMFSSIYLPNVLLPTGVVVTTGRTYAVVIKRQVAFRFI